MDTLHEAIRLQGFVREVFDFSLRYASTMSEKVIVSKPMMAYAMDDLSHSQFQELLSRLTDLGLITDTRGDQLTFHSCFVNIDLDE